MGLPYGQEAVVFWSWRVWLVPSMFMRSPDSRDRMSLLIESKLWFGGSCATFYGFRVAGLLDGGRASLPAEAEAPDALAYTLGEPRPDASDLCLPWRDAR